MADIIIGLSEVLENTRKLEARLENWNTAAKQDSIDQHVADAMQKIPAGSYAGIDLAPEGAREAIEAKVRAAYDENLREEDRSIVGSEQSVRTAIAALVVEYEQVQKNAETFASDPNVRLMAQLLAGQREQAARQLLTGRTLADVARVYEQTTDQQNPELIAIIETDRESLKLAIDPKTDAAAVLKIQSATKVRRAARVKANAPKLIEAGERLDALGQSATLDMLRRHVRGGRGLALKPPVRTAALAGH